MPRRAVHHARVRHGLGHAMLPPHAHPRPTPPLEDEEVFATLDASADEPVDAELQDRDEWMTDATITWRGARRDSWEADDDRAEVDRFLRDHFASDELEVA